MATRRSGEPHTLAPAGAVVAVFDTDDDAGNPARMVLVTAEATNTGAVYVWSDAAQLSGRDGPPEATQADLDRAVYLQPGETRPVGAVKPGRGVSKLWARAEVTGDRLRVAVVA